MKILFNNPYLGFFALFSFLVFTISCKDTEIKELPKLKKAPPAIEIVVYINNVIKKKGETFIVIDVIEYKKNSNSADQNKTNRIDFPNGYSIINEKIEFTERAISDSVIITMQTLNYDDHGNFKFNEKTDFDKFEQIYLNPEYDRYKHIPFKVTLIDNQITSITEIYIP